MIPPLLHAIQHLRWSLSSGRPLIESFEDYLRNDSSAFAEHLREVWILKKNGQLATARPFPTHYQFAFWDLLQRGLNGQPIHDALRGLEDEVIRAAQAELDQHIAALPFKTLLPLLAFQFPAFLIVLLGPVLRDLQTHLGGM